MAPLLLVLVAAAWPCANAARSPFAAFARSDETPGAAPAPAASTRKLQEMGGTGENFPGVPVLEHHPMRGVFKIVYASDSGDSAYDEYEFFETCDSELALDSNGQAGGYLCGALTVMAPPLFCRGDLYYYGSTPQPTHHLMTETTTDPECNAPEWGNSGTAARNVSHHYRIRFRGYKLDDDGEVIACPVPANYYAVDLSYLGDGVARTFVHVHALDCDPCNQPNCDALPLHEPEKEQVVALAADWYEDQHAQAPILDSIEVFDNCKLPHAEHGQHMYSVRFVGSSLEVTLRAFVLEVVQNGFGQVEWAIAAVNPPGSGIELEPKHTKEFPDGTVDSICNLNVTTPPSEVAALLAFDREFGMAEKFGRWSSSDAGAADPCAGEWPKVQCTTAEEGNTTVRVTALKLSLGGVEGKMHWGTLWPLTDLRRLGFTSNRITGVLPSAEDFASWPKLEYLHVDKTLLSGTLPESGYPHTLVSMWFGQSSVSVSCATTVDVALPRRSSPCAMLLNAGHDTAQHMHAPCASILLPTAGAYLWVSAPLTADIKPQADHAVRVLCVAPYQTATGASGCRRWYQSTCGGCRGCRARCLLCSAMAQTVQFITSACTTTHCRARFRRTLAR
eukprot:COSAG02_NODE_3120_length_7329_cov_2.938866_5_plen_618_part_00